MGRYLKEDRFLEIEAWRKAHSISFFRYIRRGVSPEDLQRIATALAPKSLVPIHSAFPEKYARIHPHVDCHADGQWCADRAENDKRSILDGIREDLRLLFVSGKMPEIQSLIERMEQNWSGIESS